MSASGRGPVFLDLDGAAVWHSVGLDFMEGRRICSFDMLHPDGGYLIGVTADCQHIDDWRGTLRGIINALSDRTVSVQSEARCDAPPAHVRIRPKAHWSSIDQNQALHDWAVARDVRLQAQ